MTAEKTHLNIAIFASGTGSNTQKIIEYFKGHDLIRVALVLSNKADAGVLQVAANHGLPVEVFDRETFYQTNQVLERLKSANIVLVVLAGFLWLVPQNLLEAYEGRMVNIHPALLPKFGGKGMYGKHVYKAVSESGDTRTGITIHFVNDRYDQGDVISQFEVGIEAGEAPDSIAEKVRALEHAHYPSVIEDVLRKVDHG